MRKIKESQGSPSGPNGKRLFLSLGLVASLIFLGSATGCAKAVSSDSQKNDSSNDSSAIGDTPIIDETSWIPAGFTQYSGDASLAWRWGKSSETTCSYSGMDSVCWSAFVIAENGCSSSLYGEIAILDSSDVQIDYTNDSTTAVQPMQKVKLTFDTFNSDAASARMSVLNCY